MCKVYTTNILFGFWILDTLFLYKYAPILCIVIIDTPMNIIHVYLINDATNCLYKFFLLQSSRQ